MAKLAEPYNLKIQETPGDYRGNFQKELQALTALEQNSLKIDCDDPKCDLKGAFLKFSVADGYACYIVICSSPLTVAHIPYGDKYSIAPAHIRGLNRADIIQQLKLEKILNPPKKSH